MSPLQLFDLTGKIACVTGCSSGLGKRAVETLSAAGAKVIGVARRIPDSNKLHGYDPEHSVFVSADLSQRDQLKKTVERINAPFGSPDILINCAGVNFREPADKISDSSWDTTVELNLSVPFFLSNYLIPAMKDKGWGRIVNVASLQSFRAFTNGIAYGASKGGITQLTRAMAESWSRFGINVNAIGPGFFPTELTAPVFANESLAKHHAEQTCIGRNGELQDIDGPLLFLCSRASTFVTGQILMVDGGFTAK